MIIDRQTNIIICVNFSKKMNTKSRTETQQTKTIQQPQQKQQQQQTLILRLQQKPPVRVTWTEETIDNEHMNKKKSNLCCIYHRPGQSSSDTCTSDDEGNALERDRHTKHLHKKVCSKRKDNDNKDGKQQNVKKPHNHQHEKKFMDE